MITKNRLQNIITIIFVDIWTILGFVPKFNKHLTWGTSIHIVLTPRYLVLTIIAICLLVQLFCVNKKRQKKYAPLTWSLSYFSLELAVMLLVMFLGGLAFATFNNLGIVWAVNICLVLIFDLTWYLIYKNNQKFLEKKHKALKNKDL